MGRRKTGKKRTNGGLLGKLFGRRQQVMLEEQEWRQRLILASRKIQQVHMSLSADMADVRGLREHLRGTSPEIQKLERELNQSRQRAGGLEERLSEHTALLLQQMEQMKARAAEAVDTSAYESRLRELEAEIESLRAQLAEAGARHTEELRALAQEKDARITELDQLVQDRSQRLAALEAQPNGEEQRQALEAQHAQQVGQLQAALAAGQQRVAELEARAQEVDRARAEETERRNQELQALAREKAQLDQLVQERTQRLAALEQQGASDDHKQTLEAQYTQQIQELQAALQAGQQRAREAESRAVHAEQTRSAESARHGEELQGLQRVTSSRIQELEGQLSRMKAQPAHAVAAPDAASQEALEGARKRVAMLELQLRGLETLRGDLEKAHAESVTIQETSKQHIAQLEGRVRAADDQRAQLTLKHEEELKQFKEAANFKLTELHQKLEQAESQQAEATSGSPREEELRHRVQELEEAQAELKKAQQREMAESAARIMELEAFNQELSRAREESEEAHRREGEELTVLRAQVRDVERMRRELEHSSAEASSSSSAAHEARIQELQAEIQVLRRGREESARQHAGELSEGQAKRERMVQELQRELKESEMARLELETRHTSEMSDLADHSYTCMQNLENMVQEKEESIRSITSHNRELEGALERMRVVTQNREQEADDLKRKLSELEERHQFLKKMTSEEPTIVHLAEEDDDYRARA